MESAQGSQALESADTVREVPAAAQRLGWSRQGELRRRARLVQSDATLARRPQAETAPQRLADECGETCTPQSHLPWTPDSYRTCCAADPCPAEAECVLGLCLPRCNGEKACVEGAVCWPEGCLNQCDATHPCTQAFSCVDGACVADPCGHPQFWALSKPSSRVPVVVHFRDEAERCMANQILTAVENAWTTQTQALKFWPPVSDKGLCGPNGAFDAFVWRSYRAAGVDVVAPNEATWWDDYSTYLIVDAWGPYGGELLTPTVAHELNHAMQAAYDWWETPIVFEMTSQFIEGLLPGRNSYRELLFDYQQNPDWAFDFNDDYATWYMYGSAMYLAYLRDGVFNGDSRFVAEMWKRSRNRSGRNEPDFEDALNSLLHQRAWMSFQDSIIEFSRWRYYTSTRDDGRHFRDGATYPENSLAKIERRVRVTPQTVDMSPGPMKLGVHYVQLFRQPGDPARVTLDFHSDPRVRWSVQVVPGLSHHEDGETLDLSSGSAKVSFGHLSERTLVILALPRGKDEPDQRNDHRYPYRFTLHQ